MATKGYNLEQTGEQVQAALNKAINLGPATEEADGLMTAADKASLENLNTEINDKVDKVTGKGLSTNDFTNEDKSKLDTAYQVPSTGIPAADMSSGVQTSLGKANSAVQPADLVPITEKIPAQASAQNQLADKAFVNSSISTASADFKGTYDSLSELQAVTADKNDYGYVVSTDEAGNTVYSRYKYNGSSWVFEYDLNNSSFTAAEWAAIQSGITAPLVQKLGALPTNADLQSALSGKQATLVSGTNIKTVDGQSILGSGNLSVSDPNAVKVTAQTWTDAQKTQARTNIGAYAKPSGGIPKTDLAAGVQGSLDLADSAIQARPSGEVDPTITPAEYATQEELAQLEAKVDDLSTGKYYGYFAQEEDLPEADVDGFAYVGEGPTYTIYNLRGGVWTSSEITVNQSPIGNDEDINQNEDGKLQFANRVYNAQQPNGMGYKILRKDATFASQVSGTNTIYEIRYQFNLNNASVTIPAGSVLRFNGGKITGGSINFNGCSLEKKDSDNVFENITAFSGAVSGYFTPENVSYGLSGDCFSALLTFLKSGQILLKVKTLTLTSDTDFNGVWLDAERIELNGHTLKLGGTTNRVKDGNLTPVKSQDQSILVIGTNGVVGNGRVIVGSCSGYELHLGLLVGAKLEFLLDGNYGIGYSSFYLNTVTSIELSAASGVTDAWINSNRFVLNRCISFVVKSSLRYFNNNTIQMGCFEGAFNIRLEKGSNNYFKDIRGESVSQGRGTVYFGENTGSNVIDIMFYPYTKFYDYGRANIINENNLYRYRLIDKANISLQDLKKNLPSRIMGMSLSQDGTYMVPSSTYDVLGSETSFARYYQTGFIPYKKRMTIIAILDVIAKNEPGLAFAYELYDANFDPVFVKDSGGTSRALGMIRTTQDAYNNFKSGTYFLPFAQQTNYRPGGTHTINNNYVVFQFNDQPVFDAIASGAEGLEEALDAVKYITISVIGSSYYYSFNSQLLSVGVSVYASEFKARLFSSDVE